MITTTAEIESAWSEMQQMAFDHLTHYSQGLVEGCPVCGMISSHDIPALGGIMTQVMRHTRNDIATFGIIMYYLGLSVAEKKLSYLSLERSLGIAIPLPESSNQVEG